MPSARSAERCLETEGCCRPTRSASSRTEHSPCSSSRRMRRRAGSPSRRSRAATSSSASSDSDAWVRASRHGPRLLTYRLYVNILSIDMRVRAEDRTNASFLARVIDLFLVGDLPVWLILLSLLGGAVALVLTPREEEPQIVVPIADVYDRGTGASGRGGRTPGRHPPREAPHPDRRRRVRLLHVAAWPGARDGAVLRGRGSRRQPGQDLQQARVEPRPGAAGGHGLGGEADRDRRRADPDRDALERPSAGGRRLRAATDRGRDRDRAPGRGADESRRRVRRATARRGGGTAARGPRRTPDLGARRGVGAPRLERARTCRHLRPRRRDVPRRRRRVRRRRRGAARARGERRGRPARGLARRRDARDGPDEAASYTWLGLGPADRRPRRCAPRGGAFLSRPSTSRSPSRRGRNAVGVAGGSRPGSPRSSARTCRRASTSASRATTARRPTTRSTS